MNINLISIGQKMPEWINTGFKEYARRMPMQCQLILHEIPALKRGKNADLARIKLHEGKQLLKAIPDNNHVIALDRLGKTINTQSLADSLKTFHELNQSISFLVGGPEGLSNPCMATAHQTWSLSHMTFPHPLVRILLAEQLYRAWTILSNHPYHK